MEPAFVIIEGAADAAALSSRLELRYGFTVVRYFGTGSFVDLLDRLIFSHSAPRLCLSLGHLSALDRNAITPGYFREFESAAALGGARLVLVTKGASTGQVVGFGASTLKKRAVDDARRGLPIVLDWLGLGEGLENAG